MNAYRSLDRFRREASEYTWLARIAVNAAKNRFRSRDRRRQVEADGGDFSEAAEQVADMRPELSPFGAVEAQELGEAIDAAIGTLPEELRMVIVLRDIEGYSYKEIADVTEASIDNVKTRIFRGRSRVRRMLEPYLRGDERWE